MYLTITGKSGSGKSRIGKYLESLDSRFLYIDVDKVGHLVLEEDNIKKEVQRQFHLPFTEDGTINRGLLGNIVFQNPDKMEQYASITWPRMEKQLDTMIENNPGKIIILDWALIPKTKYFANSLLNILVEAPYEVRLLRAEKRDLIDEEKFKEREKASLSYEHLEFDFKIENMKVESTEGMVKKIYEKSIISRKF